MQIDGALLKQIEPATGKNNQYAQAKGDGGDTLQARQAVAEAAGMSKRQQVTAIRVANVPQEDFDRQVESANPPTVTKLAEQGKKAAPKPVIEGECDQKARFMRAFFAGIARFVFPVNTRGKIGVSFTE